MTERYLRWVWELAVEGVAAGMSALDVAREADLGEFADLLDAERLVGNLRRAYVELTESGPLGTPIDLLDSFREMVEFHGGLPDCHA
ncbi:MAG: hypothetical protein ACR2GH_00445 [Pseudonocardia sp.]